MVNSAELRVQRPAQQGLGLQRLHALSPAARQRGGHFGRQFVVLLGHFDQRGQIAGRLDGLLQGLQDGLQSLQLGDDFAGFLLVIPEVGGRHLLLDRLDLF